jgi:hypothetical protein
VNETWQGRSTYATRTRASTYTFVLVAPFLVIYEIGLVALRLTCSDFHARNGADAIIRNILFPLGLQTAGTAGAFVWSVLSALVLLACFAVWRSREKDRPPFEARYVAWAFAEAAAWAFVLFLCSMAFFSGILRADNVRASMGGGVASIMTEIVFNAGAGVYEELVFRVFLVLVLSQLFIRIAHFDRLQGGVAAALGAAVIFSLMHFGARPGADPWGGDRFVALFVFRWLAGIFFSLLFYFRSFGMAVATHALYDTMVTAMGLLAIDARTVEVAP